MKKSLGIMLIVSSVFLAISTATAGETAEESRAAWNRIRNYIDLGDIQAADREMLENVCGKIKPDDVATDTTYGFYGLFFCKKQPVIVLLASNKSPLVQELLREIVNGALEAIFIEGLSVMKHKNYALRQHPKGVVIYIELKGSPDIFDESYKRLTERGQIEVFFKSEKQSTKFLLSLK